MFDAKLQTQLNMKASKVLLLFFAGLLFAANISCDDENAESGKEDAEGSVYPV